LNGFRLIMTKYNSADTKLWQKIMPTRELYSYI
jgi:hypothetical protein